jgi:hypothetical protein
VNSGLKPEEMFGSRPENEKLENEKLNSRFTLIGPVKFKFSNVVFRETVYKTGAAAAAVHFYGISELLEFLVEARDSFPAS